MQKASIATAEKSPSLLTPYYDRDVPPLPPPADSMKSKDGKDVRWVEGLRGISALLIVTSHIFAKFDPNLESPAPSENATPTLLQLPIVRLIIAGRSSLSFFFLLTGFVNSLAFLRETSSGNHDVALSRLARSSFRRIGRLVLPATAATTLSWALCQLGAYGWAKRGDVAWLRDMTPDPSPTLPWALWSLIRECWKTWVKTSNEYDKVQWNLFFLLKASIFVYAILLMTTFVTVKARRWCFVGYYVYSWGSNDSLIGMNISAGLFLASLLTEDTTSLPFSPTTRRIPSLFLRLIPLFTLTLGALLAGFPEKNPSWSPWSHFFSHIGHQIFPQGAELDRHYSSIGTTLILLGALYSPHAKSALSHPWLGWMGKVSFAVFLIHTALIRSLLAVMVFGGREGSQMANGEGKQWIGWVPRRTGGAMAASLGLFFPVLYLAAWAWWRWVEKGCGKAMAWVEARMESQ